MNGGGNNYISPPSMGGFFTPGGTNAFGGTTGGSNRPLSFKQAYPASVQQTGED